MDPVVVALQYRGLEQVKAALQDVRETIASLDEFSAESGRASARARIRALRAEAAEVQKLGGQRSGGGLSPSSSGGGRRLSGSAREAFDRAVGASPSSSVQRATSGAPIADSAGASGLLSLAGKAGAAGAAFAILKSGIDFAADALKQFGGFLISDVIKPAFALETKAQQIENAAGGSISAKEIQDKTRTAGLKHNMDPTLLLEAAEKMIDLTGDAKASFDLLDTVGTLAKGRGADAGQLAEFAATLKNFDPNLNAAQVSDLLMTQLAQGDKGSVPLKEAARLGGRLTAPAAMLAGNTDVRMASMGALLQTGRKGFGSTDELATAIGNLINEVSSQKMTGSKKYLNAEGQIGDVASLISGILKQTGGDAKKIGALGLSDPASKLVKAYLPTFNEAGKGDKGGEAVETLIRGFMEARTSLDREKENERKVLQTSGEKWNATIEQLKNRLLVIMPEVDKFVSKFAKIAPQFGDALVTLAQIMVKVAGFLADLFDVDTDATGQSRGEYKINPETGQFEFVKQSELNERKKNDIFDPLNYEGPGLVLKNPPAAAAGAKPEASPGPAPSIAPLLATPGTAPPVVPALTSGGSSASSTSGPAPKLDALNVQIDALGPKIGRLGIAFDKLSESAADANRSKPLTAR